MPQLDPVDVLIIGSGASGAAVAWSLADTKMRIVCLEQGGWIDPAEIAAIRFGSEGQRWQMMPVATFIAHDGAIPAMRQRVAMVRDALRAAAAR